MRNVRPSWVKVKVDNKTVKETGPRARTGELATTFYVRDNGVSVLALMVDMIASADGNSVLLRVTKRGGDIIHEETVAQ